MTTKARPLLRCWSLVAGADAVRHAPVTSRPGAAGRDDLTIRADRRGDQLPSRQTVMNQPTGLLTHLPPNKGRQSS